MNTAKIVILGGGLSAAFAWRACLDHGILPEVITDRIFTPPGGFIWVHELPKSVKVRSLFEHIKIEGVGTAEGYAKKMWGKKIKTSFPEKDYDTQGVNPPRAAKVLWGDTTILKPRLHKATVDSALLDRLKKENDLIILTFPLVTAKPEWEIPIWVRIANLSTNNLAVYQGDNEEPFVRYAYLFGIQSWEFPPQRSETGTHSLEAQTWGSVNGFMDDPRANLWYAPEIAPEEIEGKIAVENYADNNVLYCGRWATGNRKFLSHQVYDRVVWHMRRQKLIT